MRRIKVIPNAFHSQEAEIFSEDKKIVIKINLGTFYFSESNYNNLKEEHFYKLGEHCIYNGSEEVIYDAALKPNGELIIKEKIQ